MRRTSFTARKYLARVNPFLVAVLMVAFLYAENVNEAPFMTVALVMVWSLVGTAFVMAVVWLVLRRDAEAGFVTVVWLLLFFLYGHIFDLIRGVSIDGFIIGRFRYLVGAEIIVGILTVLVAYRAREFCQRATPVITVVLLALVVFNLADVARYQLGEAKTSTVEVDNFEIPLLSIPRDQLPDIYFIILDSYPRQDVLQSIYAFDNSEFLDYLERNDFYVATDSRTNYMQTTLSLASSLNMDYLQQLIGPQPSDSTNSVILQDLVKDNKAALFAQRMGYRFAFLRSNWVITLTNPNADKQLSRLEYPWGAFGRIVVQPIMGNEFGYVFARSTMLRSAVDVGILVAAVDLFNNKIERLQRISEVTDPTFTFAHFAPPHVPYVFDRDGNANSVGFALQSYADKDAYLDQLIWVNKSMEKVIDQVFRINKGNSVIVIQSDHGTQLSDVGKVISYGGLPDDTLVFERSGILNVLHLPDTCKRDGLYESITPVNTFRLIFDACLGTEFGLLDDNSYWSSYDRPYDFTPIEDLLAPNGRSR